MRIVVAILISLSSLVALANYGTQFPSLPKVYNDFNKFEVNPYNVRPAPVKSDADTFVAEGKTVVVISGQAAARLYYSIEVSAYDLSTYAEGGTKRVKDNVECKRNTENLTSFTELKKLSDFVCSITLFK